MIRSTAIALMLIAGAAVNGEPIPEAPLTIIETYCLDCHDADTEKGDINLEHAVIDWRAAGARKLWEHVLKASEEGRMPPEDKPQPSEKERAELAA